MLSRSIGGVLRGKGTPLQFLMACVLGAMIGFVPGLMQAPGLVVALTLLLIVLNTNLFLALTAGLIAKFLALLLLPASFVIGRALLDGPTQPLFAAMINAPVLAFFGFEYYAVTGGQVLGIVFGVVIGLAVVKLVSLFRVKMAAVEENSERYKTWTCKWWVKVATWIFAGSGKGKLSYQALLTKKIGNPIRPLGVVFAAGVVVVLFLVKALASGPIVAAVLKSGLEKANGATVDVRSTEVDLGAGRMTITGLAMCDASALDTDLLRAVKLEGQISTTDLLRKRIALDKVVVSDATHGEKRKTPGHLTGTRRIQIPEDPPEEGAKRLEDYLNDAKVWRERLVEAKDWLEKLSGHLPERSKEEKQETLKERLERQIREVGYAAIVADHLIEGAPSFLLRELVAEKVRTPHLVNETVDVVAKNLSTHPNLVPEPPSLVVHSSASTLDLALSLGEACLNPRQNSIVFAYRKLPTDSFTGRIKLGDTRPFTGGTFDVSTTGRWSTAGKGMLELPLQLAFNQVVVTLPKVGAQTVKQLHLPLGIAGSFDRPRVRLDEAAWKKALADAGVNEAVGVLKTEAVKLSDQAKSEASKKASEQGKQLLDSLIKRR